MVFAEESKVVPQVNSHHCCYKTACFEDPRPFARVARHSASHFSHSTPCRHEFRSTLTPKHWWWASFRAKWQ